MAYSSHENIYGDSGNIWVSLPYVIKSSVKKYEVYVIFQMQFNCQLKTFVAYVSSLEINSGIET